VTPPPTVQDTRDLRNLVDLIDYEQLAYLSIYAHHTGRITVSVDSDDQLAAWLEFVDVSNDGAAAVHEWITDDTYYQTISGRVQPMHGGGPVALVLTRPATDTDRARLGGAS
jgi:hypothetical protein